MRDYQPYCSLIPEHEQTWREYYTQQQPLVLEIGCGVGFHPIQYSLAHPEHNMIAIEKTKERFTKFKRRYSKHKQATNLLPVQANAIDWISQNIQPKELSQIFLLYPCPYPKNKQANKRWFNMPFMGHLLQCLQPGGTLTLVTNEQFYFEEACERAQSTWNVTILKSEAFTSSQKPRTHFEKKYLEAGQTCYELIIQP